ncbi:hypothetical protein [Massilia sp. YMA4]|uniref:Uncharacterized protein n=1 Tax=[Empedobacter] haloabium TaxID=592317 RepID=A0ABZ1UQ85_9BURK|nr:hypothetical protein [Massilia sp. YMA4]AXA91949.1 hypothetical protein DPH57_12825 [Massilia sp. YMA4]
MPDTIHRNFKQVADAESARAALLQAGFHGSAVQLNLHDARAQDTTTNAVDNIMDSLTPDDADDTDHPVARPAALLSVDVDTEQEREQANTIMLRFGGVEA